MYSFPHVCRCGTVFAFSAIALTIQACNPFDSQLVKACEEAIKYRLKSPSSYERISVAESQSDLTIDEYRAFQVQYMPDWPEDMIEDDLEGIKTGKTPYTVYMADIEYEAQNGFGATVRMRSTCETQQSHPREFSVMVDGQNNTAWLANRHTD